MRTDRIEKTRQFLQDKLFANLKGSDYDKQYRYEHSMRVANAGATIAKAEGFDIEAMIIACLLHDISYSEPFASKEDWLAHGRNSEKISRPFLKELGFEGSLLEDMCYGIAMHADGNAGYEGTATPFALTIGEADDVDRYDAYRTYEILASNDYKDKSNEEKLDFLHQGYNLLEYRRNCTFGTETAKKIIVDLCNEREKFYRSLEEQIKNSLEIRIPE